MHMTEGKLVDPARTPLVVSSPTSSSYAEHQISELAAVEQQAAGLQEISGSNGSGAIPALSRAAAASTRPDEHSG